MKLSEYLSDIQNLDANKDILDKYPVNKKLVL